MADWGLGIWSIRVGLIGCRPVEILEESLTLLEANLSRDFRYINVNKDFFGSKELGKLHSKSI